MDTSPDPGRETATWIERARRHPVAAATLVASMLIGAAICALYLPESISMPRRVVGGLLVGGLSWLLVMVGRLLD